MTGVDVALEGIIFTGTGTVRSSRKFSPDVLARTVFCE